MQDHNTLTTACGSRALLQAWPKTLLPQLISSGINMFTVGTVRTKQDSASQLQAPTRRKAHGADVSIRKDPSTFQGNLELAAKLLGSAPLWPEQGPTSSQTPGREIASSPKQVSPGAMREMAAPRGIPTSAPPTR